MGGQGVAQDADALTAALLSALVAAGGAAQPSAAAQAAALQLLDATFPELGQFEYAASVSASPSAGDGARGEYFRTTGAVFALAASLAAAQDAANVPMALDLVRATQCSALGCV